MALSTWKDYAEEFAIFAKYSGTSEGYDHVAGEHDELWAGPNPEVVSEEDAKLIKKLGWTPHMDNECWHKNT